MICRSRQPEAFLLKKERSSGNPRGGLVPIVAVAAVVLPLERLKIRKVVGPAFFDRIDITDLPTEVGQRFAVGAVLHPGAEYVTAIEIAVVSLGDFAF